MISPILLLFADDHSISRHTPPSTPLLKRMSPKPCTSQAFRRLTPPLTSIPSPSLQWIEIGYATVLTTCGSPECCPVPLWALVPCLAGMSSVLVSALSSPERTLKCLQG